MKHFSLLIAAAFVVELAVAAALEWPTPASNPQDPLNVVETASSDDPVDEAAVPQDASEETVSAMLPMQTGCDATGEIYLCSP